MKIGQERYEHIQASTEKSVRSMQNQFIYLRPKTFVQSIKDRYEGSEPYSLAEGMIREQAVRMPLKTDRELPTPTGNKYNVSYPGLFMATGKFMEGFAVGLNSGRTAVTGDFNQAMVEPVREAFTVPGASPHDFAAIIEAEGLEIFDNQLDYPQSVVLTPTTVRPVVSLRLFAMELANRHYPESVSKTEFKAGVGMGRRAIYNYVLSAYDEIDDRFESLMASSGLHSSLFEIDE